ncbi:MAG: AfsR/SARP family transcriptional regulator [Streptosporangiaceae bacterium]|nr:AfsR/SARP family transcriptional regulator [Streptosporangiaceae bacterium]
MKYRVLGPLEVCAVTGERISIARPKHRQLLATLLLSHNAVVTTDHLIENLWEDGQPNTARGLLKTYIWGVRRLLSPRDPTVAPIETLIGGYRMPVDTSELDLLVFSKLAKEGRELLRGGHLDAADDALRRALSLWRGPALQGVPKSWSLIDAAANLDEERLNAVEDWAEVRLTLGCHVDVAGQLRPWVRANPLRERLWGQLMLALYRSGRRGEALQMFHELRRELDDELGIAPSDPVRNLHEQILRGEPGLLVPGSASLYSRADTREALVSSRYGQSL